MRGLYLQIQHVLDVLPEGGAGATLSNLDQLVRTDPVLEAYQDLYARVGPDFALSSFNSITRRKDERQTDQWMDWMHRYVETDLGGRISDITEVTLNRLQRSIQSGIDEGLGIEAIAERITRSNAVNSVRARVIARTEIIGASNAGSDLGARSTGLSLQKEWISTPDGRTRPDHEAADGQTVDMDELFIVGGEQAQYPGDPSLSAGNVIQCRCTQAYIT